MIAVMPYFFRRLTYGLLVLLGVVTIVFSLFQGIGDPARLVMGQTGDAATLQNIRRELNLDLPPYQQFILYLNDVSPIAFHDPTDIQEKQISVLFTSSHTGLTIKLPYLRRSYQSKKLVWDILSDALAGTAVLAITSICFAFCLGIILGVGSAVAQGSWLDRILVSLSITGISVPSFFLGLIIAYVFGFVLSDITGLHMSGSLYDIDPFHGQHLSLKNLVLPALTLGLRPLAIITQLTRSAMLDALQQDFVRTARAKGLPESSVIWRHALPNALNPVITSVTGWFAELLAGAFFVEFIFGWKGIGKVTVDALEKLDYPIVMGSILLTSFIFIVVSILADLIQSWYDPRIRIQ